MVWTAPASPFWSGPGPFLYGGAQASFAEVVHASAFHSVIPAGSIYANLDLDIQLLRPVFPSDGELTGFGRLVRRGRSILVANVEVHNPAGKTVLIGTGSAALVPGGLAWLLAQRPPGSDASGDLRGTKSPPVQ